MRPNYINYIPKEWFGISGNKFHYKKNIKDENFSLTLFTGEKAIKIWESGLREWQFLD